jgi:formylglycine-generating enzyme required for sulfatase activity
MRSDQSLAATERAACGNILARLGDPRFRPDAWYLPDEPLLGFVEIPAGDFLMGSDKKKDARAGQHELQQHKLTLPLYYIAHYPVTVGQFLSFVNESGYKPERPESLNGLPNHPVVNVTWHEAQKYCERLSERLRNWQETPEPLASLLKGQGWCIALPSEAEWEKAARGNDGRIYPWGEEENANLANYLETGIGRTSAVGCFAGGASPHDCEEMSGNVWEWTRSLWGKDPDKPEFRYPYDPKDGRENLNAPDEVLRVLRGGSVDYGLRLVRCSARYGGFPYVMDVNFGFRVALSPFTLASEASEL